MSSTAIVVSDTSRSAPALLRPKWSRMSGSSTANAARSSSSTAFRPKRTMSGKVGAPRVIAEGRHSSTHRLSPPSMPLPTPVTATAAKRRVRAGAGTRRRTPPGRRRRAVGRPGGDPLARRGRRPATRGGARGRTRGRWSSRRARATCARPGSGSVRAPAATMLVPAARAAVRPSSRMNIGTRNTPPLLARRPLSTPMAKAGTTTNAARSRQAAARSAWSAASGNSTRAPTMRRSTPRATSSA